MKNNPVVTVLIMLVFMTANSCSTNSKDELKKEIDRIAVKWVPDKRIAICNAELRQSQESYILKGETTIPEAHDDIIKALGKHNIKLIDSLLILPDTTVNTDYHGIVSLSVINLRKEPDHASELISQTILGTPVLILKDEGSWLLVQTPDSYIAWTETSSIKSMSTKDINNWKKAERVIYLESTGWLYDGISESRGVVSDLVGGSIMEKTGEMRDWVSVKMPDGRKGFVEKKMVTDFNTWKTSVSCTEESICSTALRFMGIPYLWGGTSFKGADCSGFVKTVFFMNGLILQRDASLQALHGAEVSVSEDFSQVKKGDLLFFGSKRENGTPHVTHVAIYMGEKKYINAAGRVMINSFDPSDENYISYRNSSLLSARRIIGTIDDSGIVHVSKHSWY